MGHQGAGCQLWKLQDVSGTQPPLCEAVVKLHNCTFSEIPVERT